jgi:hypothetical protein
MIDGHNWTTPNGHKEEADVSYKIVPVNISAGEHFLPEFLEVAQQSYADQRLTGDLSAQILLQWLAEPEQSRSLPRRGWRRVPTHADRHP